MVDISRLSDKCGKPFVTERRTNWRMTRDDSGRGRGYLGKRQDCVRRVEGLAGRTR
jgi:hypothetical protein